MAYVARITDITRGHDHCKPVPIVTGTDLMIVEEQKVARITDKVEIHGCPEHPPHQGVIVEASKLVIVDEQWVARIGDKVGGPCPKDEHLIATGSSLVDILE